MKYITVKGSSGGYLMKETRKQVSDRLIDEWNESGLNRVSDESKIEFFNAVFSGAYARANTRDQGFPVTVTVTPDPGSAIDEKLGRYRTASSGIEFLLIPEIKDRSEHGSRGKVDTNYYRKVYDSGETYLIEAGAFRREVKTGKVERV